MHLAIDAVGIQQGGGGSILKELVRQLPFRRPEWKVTVFLFETVAETLRDAVGNNAEIRSVPQKSGFVGRSAWTIRELPANLEALEADCLLAFANIGTPFPKIPQVTYVQQALPFVRERYFRTFQGVLRERLLLLGISRGVRVSSRVIVQTQSMKELLLAQVPSCDSKIVVVPGGLGQAFLHSKPSAGFCERLRQFDEPLITYVADGCPHKNHVVLFKAMACLKQLGHRCRLGVTLPGPGAAFPPSEPSPQNVRRLHRLAETLGLGGSDVTWFGTLQPGDVRELLRHSDVAAFPSLSESFGLPLLEGRFLDLPTVASDRPFAREVADPMRTAFVEPHDDRAWALSLRDMISAGFQRRDRSAEDTVPEGVSYDSIVEAIARSCEDAVGEWWISRMSGSHKE